ncbi:hypothetical protein B0H14DRAFT_3683473 [Mycena olivaceomarginata]|nr:hypothetical protein B0H14DRAFT_3683473 [Mycena olivaceomarginata]
MVQSTWIPGTAVAVRASISDLVDPGILGDVQFQVRSAEAPHPASFCSKAMKGTEGWRKMGKLPQTPSDGVRKRYSVEVRQDTLADTQLEYRVLVQMDLDSNAHKCGLENFRQHPHQLLRGQDRETLVIEDPHSIPPNAESVITAKTVQLFIRHNFIMNDPEKDTTYSPFGYREDMNDFDHSSVKWSYYIEENQWTTWHVENELPTLSPHHGQQTQVRTVSRRGKHRPRSNSVQRQVLSPAGGSRRNRPLQDANAGMTSSETTTRAFVSSNTAIRFALAAARLDLTLEWKAQEKDRIQAARNGEAALREIPCRLVVHTDPKQHGESPRECRRHRKVGAREQKHEQGVSAPLHKLSPLGMWGVEGRQQAYGYQEEVRVRVASLFWAVGRGMDVAAVGLDGFDVGWCAMGGVSRCEAPTSRVGARMLQGPH